MHRNEKEFDRTRLHSQKRAAISKIFRLHTDIQFKLAEVQQIVKFSYSAKLKQPTGKESYLHSLQVKTFRKHGAIIKFDFSLRGMCHSVRRIMQSLGSFTLY